MESLTTPVAAAADFLRRNGLAPLSRDNWMLLLGFWKFFPLVLPFPPPAFLPFPPRSPPSPSPCFLNTAALTRPVRIDRSLRSS